MAKTFPFAILTPYFGGVDWNHHLCLRTLERKGIPLVHLSGCPYIDHARSELVAKTIELVPEAKVLFWIDHDMIFNPEDIEPMVERCLASDFGATGAGYSLKKKGSKLTAKPASHVKSIEFYKPGFYDAEFLPLGFTAVKRHVFDKLAEDLPRVKSSTTESWVYPFFHHIIKDGYYLGEDVSFFHRVKQAGFKIAIDSEPRVHHKGSYEYTLEDCGFQVPRYESAKFEFTDSSKV